MGPRALGYDVNARRPSGDAISAHRPSTSCPPFLHSYVHCIVPLLILPTSLADGFLNNSRPATTSACRPTHRYASALGASPSGNLAYRRSIPASMLPTLPLPSVIFRQTLEQGFKVLQPIQHPHLSQPSSTNRTG